MRFIATVMALDAVRRVAAHISRLFYQGIIFRRPFFFLLVDSFLASFFLSFLVSSVLSLSEALESSGFVPGDVESTFGGFSEPAAGGDVALELSAGWVLPGEPGVTVITTAVLPPDPAPPAPAVPTVDFPPGTRVSVLVAASLGGVRLGCPVWAAIETSGRVS